MKTILLMIAMLAMCESADAQFLIARRPRLCVARASQAMPMQSTQMAGYAIPSGWVQSPPSAIAQYADTYEHVPSAVIYSQPAIQSIQMNQQPIQPIPQMWRSNPSFGRPRMQCGPNGCRMVGGW